MSSYAGLIGNLIKPRNVKSTTEEEMWNYIKEKTGKIPDTFDVSTAKEYLRVTKKIEGGKLSGGYWKPE